MFSTMCLHSYIININVCNPLKYLFLHISILERMMIQKWSGMCSYCSLFSFLFVFIRFLCYFGGIVILISWCKIALDCHPIIVYPSVLDFWKIKYISNFRHIIFQFCHTVSFNSTFLIKEKFYILLIYMILFTWIYLL